MKSLNDVAKSATRNASVLVADDYSAGTKNVFVLFADEGAERALVYTFPADTGMMVLLDGAMLDALVAHMRERQGGGATEFIDALEAERARRRAS